MINCNMGAFHLDRVYNPLLQKTITSLPGNDIIKLASFAAKTVDESLVIKPSSSDELILLDLSCKIFTIISHGIVQYFSNFTINCEAKGVKSKVGPSMLRLLSSSRLTTAEKEV